MIYKCILCEYFKEHYIIEKNGFERLGKGHCAKNCSNEIINYDQDACYLFKKKYFN